MSNLPELKHGDVFVVYGTSLISRLISWWEKISSQDNKAKASHAGIIISPSGKTFEALSNGIRRGHIDHYKGQHVVIFRHNDMNIERFWRGFDAVKYHETEIYPYGRLLLHLSSILSKLSILKMTVCSELFIEFLFKSFCNEKECNDLMMEFQNWHGWNPDEAEDKLRSHDLFTTVFDAKID